MGCYRCGSADGDESRLCPQCVVSRRAEQQESKAIFHEKPEETDLVHGLAQSHWTKAALMLHAFTFFYVLLLFVGPMRAYGLTASFLFAVMSSCAIISAFIAVHFWIQLILTDTMWGLMSLLFPGFIYRYAFIHSEEPSVKVFLAFQIGTMIISIVAVLLLSAHTGESPFSLWTTFENFLYGRGSEEIILY